MRVSRGRFLALVWSIAIGLSSLLFVGPAAAQRGGGRGGGSKRGGGKRGRGRGKAVQQNPGKPAAERFLRVSRVLALEKGQLENAKAAFDSMGVKKAKILEEQQLGAQSSLTARQEIIKLGGEFEERFIALLNEDQLIELEKLKNDGTLSDQWW